MIRRATLPATAAVFLALAAFPAAAATITWWHWYPPEVWSAYEPLIEEFERETGIDVEPQYFGWSVMKERLLIGIAGGVYPDVVTVSSRWADGLAAQGAFLELAGRLDATGAGAFFPVALDLWQTAGGSRYALPLDIDAPALFYNRRLFDERGVAAPGDLDWEAWLDLAARLSADLDGDGALDQYGLTTWWYPWITLVWSSGGSIVKADRSGLDLGSPQSREAIEYYKRLHDEAPLPGAGDAERLGAADPGQLWQDGRVGMAPAGAWMPRYHLTRPGEGLDSFRFEFGVTDMPKGPACLRAVPAEGSGIAVLSGAFDAEAAWRFANFAASAEFTARVAERLEGLPAHIDVAREALLASGWGAEAFMRVVEYARPFPKGIDWWESVGPIVTRELGRYLAGSTGLQGAIENIDRQVQALMRP